LKITALAAGLAAAVGLGAAGLATQAPTQAAVPTYTFTSSPDYFNLDVGDVSVRRDWDGVHNSYNPSYAAAIDYTMGAFKETGADSYLVAGDLVYGHYGRDDANTGIFGPVDTHAQRIRHVRRAARFYFTRWQRQWTSRGMEVFPALGDHDIGDNPWGGANRWYPKFRQTAVDDFKEQFSKFILNGNHRWHPSGPARGTAYTVMLNPETRLITLDVFWKHKGDVEAKVDPKQLAWVEKVLSNAASAGVPWVIVQGHTPILRPVLQRSSSGIMYRGATNSALWKLLVKYRVDLYLCGEVHDVTAIHRDGVTQISHGGQIQTGFISYLTSQATGDRMDLQINEFTSSKDRSSTLWQTDTGAPAPIGIEYTGHSVTGTMSISADNSVVAGPTGRLAAIPAG
jgi:Calcineurin-like phosphoesterase